MAWCRVSPDFAWFHWTSLLTGFSSSSFLLASVHLLPGNPGNLCPLSLTLQFVNQSTIYTMRCNKILKLAFKTLFQLTPPYCNTFSNHSKKKKKKVSKLPLVLQRHQGILCPHSPNQPENYLSFKKFLVWFPPESLNWLLQMNWTFLILFHRWILYLHYFCYFHMMIVIYLLMCVSPHLSCF